MVDRTWKHAVIVVAASISGTAEKSFQKMEWKENLVSNGMLKCQRKDLGICPVFRFRQQLP